MTLLDDVRASLRSHASESLLPLLRRGQGLDVWDVLDVAAFGERCCVAVLALGDGRHAFVPMARSDGEWHRAEAEDSVSMAALSAVPPLRVETLSDMPRVDSQRERAIDADMSNDARVIDDRIVVKWQFLSEDGSMAGPRLVEHLRRVGFQEMPEPLARVSWSDHLVAAYTTYLPGARDGWEWMLEDLRRHLDGDLARPDWAPALASLTGRLHAAASTPSAIFPEPVVQAKMAALARHYRTLLLAELDEEMRSALEPWRERFEAAIAVLEQADSIDALPIHGDLHAGQFLLWDGGTFVSDFDGNPLLEPHDRGAPGPSAIDVAGLLRTLDHVAIAAARRSDSEDAMPRARLWAREARSEALEAYRATPGIPTLDLDVLRALETLSPLHEAAYASTYLPRWRYVPLAVLRDSN